MGEDKREDKRVVKLKYPIPVVTKQEDGTEYVKQVDTLIFNRLKTKHLKMLPKEFYESEGNINAVHLIPLIAAATNIPESSADEIDLEDLVTIGETLESFLSQFLETGEK